MTNHSLFQNSNSVHPSIEIDDKLQEDSNKNVYDIGDDFLGDVIDADTLAQAIKGGALIDVSLRAGQAGFKYPMIITRAVYDVYIDWNDGDTKRQGYQNTIGRLWDLLFQLRLLIDRMPPSGGLFSFLCIPRSFYSKLNTPVSVELKVVIGPSHDGKPIITIMMPDENGLDNATTYRSLVTTHGAPVVDATLEAYSGNLEEVVALFDDGFIGQFHSIESVAEHHINIHTPTFADIYIKHMDLEALGRDLLATNYKWVQKDGELYIFHKVNTMMEEIWASLDL